MCHTGKLLEREMKMTTARILASLLLVFVSLASAADIRNYHSGSWYDPDHSGHGISVEVVDDDTLRFTAESTNADTAATAAASCTGLSSAMMLKPAKPRYKDTAFAR